MLRVSRSFSTNNRQKQLDAPAALGFGRLRVVEIDTKAPLVRV
jgi:hypothetical protein